MQLLVATCGDRAMLGSITSGPEHYAPWRDPYPLTKDELAQRLKKRQSAVTPQDILAGVVLHPYRLLDIVHNYVTFMQTDEGKTVKVVPRYQQYRAVCRAVERLATGKTRKAGWSTGPARRDHLAHPGVGQEPHDDVPGAQAADDAGPARPARSSW